MTQRILVKRGSAITEKKKSSRTLGAMWMHELAETLTDDEREELASALALLLARSGVAA